jgi:hypothetical protein
MNKPDASRQELHHASRYTVREMVRCGLVRRHERCRSHG